MRYAGTLLLTTLLLLVGAPRAAAHPLQEEKDPGKSEAAPEAAAEDEEEKEEEDKDEYFAVVGGDVHSVTRGVLRGATILAKNGKIEEIGYHVEVPDDAVRIDAAGLRVYPGLVACASRGIVGNEPAGENTDVFALNLVIGLASGLTTVGTGNAAAKLTYGTLDDIDLARGLYTTMRYSRGDARRQLREQLDKARDFIRKKKDYDRRKAAGEEVEEPKPQGINQGHLKLLKKETVARFNAESAEELRSIARLCREYGIRAVVYGAREGWVVADELGRADLLCVINPRTTTNPNRLSNLPNGPNIENAAILHQAGVPIAVLPGGRSPGISLSGLAGRDLMTLPMEAAYAMRGGLSEQAALESVTITAARALGVDGRVGSLEIGKDADMILTDGDVLHYRTLVYYTVVNGKLAYDKEKDSLFSHIRPLPGESRFLDPALLEQLEQAQAPTEEDAAEEGEGEEGEEAEGEGEGEEGEGGDGA